MVKSAHSMQASMISLRVVRHRGIIESPSALDDRILNADRSAKAQSQGNTGGALSSSEGKTSDWLPSIWIRPAPET
jgi:hypothetical protein